jgi:hypothetical protein
VRRKRKLLIWQAITAKKRKPVKRIKNPAEAAFIEPEHSLQTTQTHSEPNSGSAGWTNFEPSLARSVAIADTPLTDVFITDSSPIPYDENLMERARTQWQFGDWESLAKLDRAVLQHHPDRAKLALLAAAGRLQTEQSAESKQYIQMAQDWGCSKKLVSQILIAGVLNSLGRAAALSGKVEKALVHFGAAVRTGTPGGALQLLTEARMNQQMDLLGLHIQDGKHVKANPYAHQGRNDINRLLSAGKFHPLNTKKTSTSASQILPRLIIINGMARSGSTVAMNIVLDLLENSSIPCMKYYIADFEKFDKLRDHIIQNPGLTCVLKTHTVSEDLKKLAKAIPTAYIYTHRNLIEVAASFVRMSKVKESPFFRREPVNLEAVKQFLRAQTSEMRNTITLEPVLRLNCDEFTDRKIKEAVENIAAHIGVKLESNVITEISEIRKRSTGANMTNGIVGVELTSLGHHRETFFHKQHVTENGTEIMRELPQEWIDSIKAEFS